MRVTAGGRRREPTIPYSVSRRTSRPAAQLLTDIAGLEVPGTHVLERGSTYLVLAPQPRLRYGPGTAVALGIAVTFAVLTAAAVSVVLIALLPLALLAAVPLIIRDAPQLAVGTSPDGPGEDTLVTVSGEMWSALAVGLHSYLAALPPAGGQPPPPTTTSQPVTAPPAPVPQDEARDS
jgi:hypothetical protein